MFFFQDVFSQELLWLFSPSNISIPNLKKKHCLFQHQWKTGVKQNTFWEHNKQFLWTRQLFVKVVPKSVEILLVLLIVFYYFLSICKTCMKYNTFFAFIKLSFLKAILTSYNVSVMRLLRIRHKTLPRPSLKAHAS